MATMSCLTTLVSSKLNNLSLNNTSSSPRHSKPVLFNSLSFSSNVSSLSHHHFLCKGDLLLSMSGLVRRSLIVCEAVPLKKKDSAVKRARQAEKKHIYNKSKKSEIKTRMKKVMDALEVLRKKPDAQPDEVVPVEKLIGEAYSAIDKAVKVGTLHRNTGARRKSRLARRKKAIEVHHGWYTPEPAAVSA
ncbi:hypothetical protein ACFE04_007955 [Oxalis oulophora]